MIVISGIISIVPVLIWMYEPFYYLITLNRYNPSYYLSTITFILFHVPSTHSYSLVAFLNKQVLRWMIVKHLQIFWYCFLSSLFNHPSWLLIFIQTILPITKTTKQNRITPPIIINTIPNILNLFTTTVKLLSSDPNSFHTLILTSIPSPNLLGIPQISPVISFTSIPSRTTLQLIPNPAASPSTLRITLNHFPPITLYEDFGYSNRHKPIPTQIQHHNLNSSHFIPTIHTHYHNLSRIHSRSFNHTWTSTQSQTTSNSTINHRILDIITITFTTNREETLDSCVIHIHTIVNYCSENTSCESEREAFITHCILCFHHHILISHSLRTRSRNHSIHSIQTQTSTQFTWFNRIDTNISTHQRSIWEWMGSTQNVGWLRIGEGTERKENSESQNNLLTG